MILFSWLQIDRSTNTNIGIGKSEDPKQTSGGKSTIGLCFLFLFIIYFVHDTILDIGIGKTKRTKQVMKKDKRQVVNQLKFLLLDRTNGQGGDLVQLGFNCTAHNKNN